MNADQIKAVLTEIALFGMLAPSVILVGLAIHEMILAFQRFGEAANTMRRRLLLNLVFLGLMGVCFFSGFQEIIPVLDIPTRRLVFMSGFVSYLWACGYAFLSWHLWASGSGRRARRRPVVEAEVPLVVKTKIEALVEPIPSIRIIHVFGDDPVPLGDPPPSL